MLLITRHGWRDIVIGTIVLALIAFGLSFIHWSFGLLALPVWVWLIAFFRDPNRALPSDLNTMVSPADGLVTDITELPDCPWVEGPALRVGIFLSVFSVHVNRSPCDGTVVDLKYKKGRFVNALHHNEASDQNESNTIVIAEPNGSRRIAAVKQIVGLIARRIICDVKQGDPLSRGQRIGMIKFGSRTELYIASFLKPQAQVKVGDKVAGAFHVIATVQPLASLPSSPAPPAPSAPSALPGAASA